MSEQQSIEDRLADELWRSTRTMLRRLPRGDAAKIEHWMAALMRTVDDQGAELDRLRAANAELVWTAERPTEPGWYWMRGRPGNWAQHGVVVQVEIYPKLEPKNRVMIVHGHSFPPVPPDAQWSGPLLLPGEKS